jgi:hypothetical protein
MQRHKQTIYSTLPDLLFDGSNLKQSGSPIYNADQDRISVVLAGIRKETTKPMCNFQFSAAPQHYFKPVIGLANPRNKKDLRELLIKSIKIDCSFKGHYFSSELARTNVIAYLHKQLEATQQNIPNFSSFAIIIVDFEAPSYNIIPFLNKKVRNLSLALEAENNFYNHFTLHSPASWMFTVEKDGSLVPLVRSTEINQKAKLRYHVSSAKAVGPTKELQRELKELRALIVGKEGELLNAAKEQDRLEEELLQSRKDKQKLEQESEKIKIKIIELETKKKNLHILRWLLSFVVVIGAVGLILLLPKLLRRIHFRGSIPEK